MYLGKRLTDELNIILYRNDIDSKQHLESLAALQDYENNQKRNAAIESDRINASPWIGQSIVPPLVVVDFAKVFNVELPAKYRRTKIKANPKTAKPKRIEFSATRTKKILDKSQNDFWQDSLYSYDLLRMLRGAVMHGVRSFNDFLYRNGRNFQIQLSAQDLKTIAEDVIPHVLLLELEDTNYAKGFIKRGENVPLINTVERFLDCLFSECFNWKYILPSNNTAGERCNVIGRQLRLGIGHITTVTDDILTWLDGEQLPTRGIVQSEPFDIESLKLLLNADCKTVVDYVMSPINADKQLQSFMSQSTVELALGCTNHHARHVITRITEAAQKLQE